MITVYTDGACKNVARPAVPGGSPRLTGLGGWAWWVNDMLHDSGAVLGTTNNIMEIMAVVKGLEYMNRHLSGEDLMIVSDSSYVVNCFADGWYLRWRTNGWVNAAGKPVKNRDLWEQLLDLYEGYPSTITFRHIRGHGKGGVADHPYVEGNARADSLCVAARKTLEAPPVADLYPDGWFQP